MLTLEQIQLVSALMGRDVSKEIALFFDARLALGKALSTEQQIFVSQHWPDVDKFLVSERGRIAADLFVSEWQESVN